MNPVEFYLSKGWVKKSGYGSRRDPITGKAGAFHHGIDFGGKPLGAPIETPYAGVVRTARYFSDAGNAVALKADDTGDMINFYHLQGAKVKPGDRVKEGQLVGLNGSTGNSTGPHLHFEIRKDDGSHFGARPGIDPTKYKVVKLVSEELKNAIEWFVQQGVISSPEYWLENAVAGKMVKGENVAAFILKTVQKLRR